MSHQEVMSPKRLGGIIMDKFEKKSIQYIINDVLSDIHKELGESLCRFHACDKCGYCTNEFDC